MLTFVQETIISFELEKNTYKGNFFAEMKNSTQARNFTMKYKNKKSFISAAS